MQNSIDKSKPREMGSAYSLISSVYSMSASTSDDSVGKNMSSHEHSVDKENITLVYDFTDNPIAEELLIEILSHVPVKDLIINCKLVCKQWKYLVDSQSVWRRKCDRETVKLPSRNFQEVPDHYYRNVYIHSTTKNKNLIKNPCGENKLEGWDVNLHTSYERVGFIVENPPAGSDPVPEEVGSQSCFATTYFTCEKFQDINLKENPVNDYLLKHDLVNIRVGEWYAARFDCASQYKLKVLLYGEKNKFIDKFVFNFIEEQWSGREWHLVTHEFTNVSKVHKIRFYHQGKDRQFWAGHYGIKMTGAFVELCLK